MKKQTGLAYFLVNFLEQNDGSFFEIFFSKKLFHCVCEALLVKSAFN